MTKPIIDPEEFVAVEASDRVNFWDVKIYDIDGETSTIVDSFRRLTEAEALQQKIAAAFMTWIEELTR